MTLGTHRFQRAGAGKDVLIGDSLSESPRSRRVIIACNRARPTPSLPPVSNGFSAYARTLEAMRTQGFPQE